MCWTYVCSNLVVVYSMLHPILWWWFTSRAKSVLWSLGMTTFSNKPPPPSLPLLTSFSPSLPSLSSSHVFQAHSDNHGSQGSRQRGNQQDLPQGKVSGEGTCTFETLQCIPSLPTQTQVYSCTHIAITVLLHASECVACVCVGGGRCYLYIQQRWRVRKSFLKKVLTSYWTTQNLVSNLIIMCTT